MAKHFRKNKYRKKNNLINIFLNSKLKKKLIKKKRKPVFWVKFTSTAGKD